MRQNFATSLASVLVHEGGFVNDPLDGGGATNKGITQRVYDDWRRSQGLAPRSVRSIEQAEVEAIYRKLYWNAISADLLPSGVDYCVFDFAVNSGPIRAAKFLQQAVGAAPDGKIGPMTIAAVAARHPGQLIDEICAERLNFLRQLNVFDHFGQGWTVRVNQVAEKAHEMADE